MDAHNQTKYQEALESGLVKTPQLVLLVLWNYSGEGMTVAKLSQAIGASVGKTSMALAALESSGSIEKLFPFRDKRTVRVYLTGEGRELALALWNAAAGLASVGLGKFNQNSAEASVTVDK